MLRSGCLIGGTDGSSLRNGSELDLILLTSEAEIRALEPEWRALLNDSSRNNVFLTWEWISSWLSCLGDDVTFRFLTARIPGEQSLVGVAPLVIHELRSAPLVKLRTLSFAALELSPDHMDLLIRNGYESSVAAAFLNWILDSGGRWDLLMLDGLSVTSPLLPVISSTPVTPWYHAHDSPCPYLPLPSDFSTWLSGLSKKRRYKIRSSRRRLESAYPGRVRIRRVSAEAELEQALTALIQLHRSVRDAHQTGNAFRSEKLIAFHRRLSRLFLERGWLRLYLLAVEETDIAALYSFQYRGVVSFYCTGYHSGFSQFSPGMLLLVHAIKDSIEAGTETFDFLRGDEDYKYFYTGFCSRDTHIRLPITLRGHLHTRLYHLGREHLRPMFRRLRTGVG